MKIFHTLSEAKDYIRNLPKKEVACMTIFRDHNYLLMENLIFVESSQKGATHSLAAFYSKSKTMMANKADNTFNGQQYQDLDSAFKARETWMKETAQDIMNSPKQTRATKLEQQGYPMKEARHAEEKLYENYNLYIKEVYNSFVRNGASNGNITGMEVYITHAPCRHLDTGSSNNVGPYSCTSKLIEISENMASVLRGPMKVYYDNYFGGASTEKQRAYYYHMVNQAKSNIIIEHSPGYFK